ncbi:hypothetical protein P9597_16595 [Aneurinibacillus migulanus]|uniref:hypothetical protein n=1 Tax=Aneurinibacillus migulanus TaxID=47500 RepID=UPI002E1ED734|nr:hypothetical protein [Aneurinibacillus migulanus]
MKDLAPGETVEVHHVYISQKRTSQPRLILYRLTEKQERGREEKWNQRRKKIKHTSKHRQTHPIYAYITNTSVKEVAKEAIYLVKEVLANIYIHLFKTHKKITAFFDGLYDLIRKNGKKSKRCNKKSPFDMLEALPG